MRRDKMTEPKGSMTPFNGKSNMIGRILEAIVVAAIVGAITLYGNYKVIDSKINDLCVNMNKLESKMEKLADKLTDHIEGK
jgi:outer membrane murein-binding lipoprotein Lpp